MAEPILDHYQEMNRLLGAERSWPERILLVASGGGHAAQLFHLAPWWQGRSRLWVTFDQADTRSLLQGEKTLAAFAPTTRNVKNLIRNFLLAARVVRRYRPDVVISTGAAVAFPFFIVARLHGARTVYLEVYDRIDSATLTGRLCYPFTSLFLLQWEEQRRFYPRGVLLGRIFA